ncbi:MAG: hypothetical protein JW783_15320 [Bacteroidales bacterium]|nr:hypothetical protein [Bacteroidales bacterium]MBN2750347.1 hypothetical protein [Bacteroidales bacterium]
MGKPFQKLRFSIGVSALSNALKNFTRRKLVYNLDTARRVGIVLPLVSQSDFDIAIKFSDYLRSKNLEICILGYFPGKELPQHFIMRQGTNIFTAKELNWYDKPKSEVVDEFANTDFDILIDLSLEHYFPLRWVISTSKAKFKVGCLDYEGNPNDLILSIDKTKGITHLVEQAKHYLSVINNRFATEETA